MSASGFQGPGMFMMVWGFCSMQAFGSNVVTRHSPWRERVLLSSFLLHRAGEAERL